MRSRLLPAVVLFLTLATLSRADTVVMKDGRSIEGEVLSEDDDSIQLKVRGIKLKLKRADVESVERSKGQPDGAGEAPVKEDPIAARFATTGTSSVDAARASSLDLYRAMDSAMKAVGNDLEATKAALDPVQRKYDALCARWKVLVPRLDSLYDKYRAEVKACGG